MTRDARTAWLFMAPAIIVVALIAVFPVSWTLWESLHLHDLRMPWRGRPLIGLGNYAEIVRDTRFWSALGHTVAFTFAVVSLELILGLALALLLNRAMRGRAALRVAALVPWAIPTVVVALVWRFIFEAHTAAWFVNPVTAWLPIMAADVWRMTPFVAILLLAGLQQIDASLYEAAQMDGAGSWRQFREITLPLLQPAVLVAVLFRALDAFRVFDLIFVMTGGGPGTATEPLSLYAFTALLGNLRFGFGSALSVMVFATAFAGAFLWIRLIGSSALLGKPE
jgi:ABC-type sugar transport system permease subunit